MVQETERRQGTMAREDEETLEAPAVDRVFSVYDEE